MTSIEKMKETRKRNKEAWSEKEAQRIQLLETIRKTCEDVLNDPEASSADKMKAVEILQGQLLRGR